MFIRRRHEQHAGASLLSWREWQQKTLCKFTIKQQNENERQIKRCNWKSSQKRTWHTEQKIEMRYLYSVRSGVGEFFFGWNAISINVQTIVCYISSSVCHENAPTYPPLSRSTNNVRTHLVSRMKTRIEAKLQHEACEYVLANAFKKNICVVCQSAANLAKYERQIRWPVKTQQMTYIK